MQRHDEIGTGLEAQSPGRVAGGDARLHRHERVDHGVADVEDALRRHALSYEIPAGFGGMYKQHLGELVGEHAVQFLGHRPVVRAESGLDMRDGDLELRRHQRCRKRRRHIPRYDEHVRPLVLEHRLEALEHARSLHRRRACTHLERPVRRRDAEFVEEDLRHRVVIVLTRVNQDVVDPAPSEVGGYRRDLHEVRPGPDHRYDAHWLAIVLRPRVVIV